MIDGASGDAGRASLALRASRRGRAGIALAALATALLGAGAGAAQEYQDYPVGPSDLLRLRVLGWDALAGAVQEWPEVTGEYVVGPDGSIAVPFAGRIESEGRSTSEIAADVVEAMRNRLALVEPPDVSVEVAAWRPVIVTGDVRTPGAVDFTPGLLAAQAVGLAGGTESALGDDAYLRREVAAAQTTLVTLRSQEQRQVARQARLEAEIAGADTVTVAAPPPGADWPSILALEEQLLRIRRDRLARELAAIDEQDQLYVAEIESLEQKRATLTQQLDLASQAAANAEDLASQGLVANQRLFDSARARADIENQLLDVSTAILTARQNIAEADRERITLQDTRIAEILEERQELDGQLAETRARVAGQIAILQALEAGELTPTAPEPEVAVLRMEGGTLNRIEDAALEPLRPGDMVEVRRPSLALGESSPASLGSEGLTGIDSLLLGEASPSASEAAPDVVPAPELPLVAEPESPSATESRLLAEDDLATIPAGSALDAEPQAAPEAAPVTPSAGSGPSGALEPLGAPAGDAVTQASAGSEAGADAAEPAPRRQPMAEPPSVSPVSRPG